MPNDPAVDGSVRAVADRIAARRAAGAAPIPDGPVPVALQEQQNDDEGYQPRQNVNVRDDSDKQVTAEQLRKAALGDDADEGDEQQLEADETPEDEIQAQDEAQDEVEDDEAGAEDEEGAQGTELAFESLDELADIIGVEVDDLLSKVKVETLVDGELGSVTLADLKKGHQLERSFTRKNQAFVSKVKNWEESTEKQRAEIADHFAKATATLNMAQQQLYSDYQSVDWAKLENENPAEWTRKRQQLGERQARLNQVMQQTTAQLQQAQEKQKQQAQEARESRYAQEHEQLMAAVPAWKKDEKLRVKQGTQIAEYLVNEVGFTPAEIEQLDDHRIILLGRAALGLAGPSKQKLAMAEKKLNKVKNLVKPGNGQQRRDQGRQAFAKKAQEAKAVLKKTGTTHDAAKALLARKLARAASAKRGRSARV